ncbi:MAG: hydroxymethylbilane synthase [Chloroflexota bacterium]
MPRIIRIGTRASTLALVQTETVGAALRALDPDITIEVVRISSTGDANPDAPLASLGIGVFTSAIEEALVGRRIDLAVHSLKDLPTLVPTGLAVVPVLEREDPRDVLVSRTSKGLMDLEAGSRVGTSSPRRAAQLRLGRPDVLFVPVRGNVETRLAKAGGPDHDAVILAAAGLRRLGLAGRISEYLSTRACTPAPGQAALAVELRADDAPLLALVRSLTHAPTAAAVEAERALLRAAGGGCQLPVGAYATVEGGSLHLFATVTALQGPGSFRVEVDGPADSPEVVGRMAYQALVEQGAGPLLTEAHA